eukprot:TRINITY_DN76326_c0_g1_i1.p1 TRINITY_DN76326_c0_g1~~TRINITY_DN76326_c0_g1_i1.p1  ORF type:complete len:284 (+),score=54.24 TRINITY_DN76326_c0_g1_i1:137-988(+)
MMNIMSPAAAAMLPMFIRPPRPVRATVGSALDHARPKAVSPVAPSLYSVSDPCLPAVVPKPSLPEPLEPSEGFSELMTGIVKCWFEDRGFGFITPDGGTEDVFVHKGVLSDGQRLIPESQVLFDLKYDTEKKGFQATRCFGATMEPAEEGGGKRKITGPYCLEDPWQELYEPLEDATHLRAHLDGLPGTEPSGTELLWKAAQRGAAQKSVVSPTKRSRTEDAKENSRGEVAKADTASGQGSSATKAVMKKDSPALVPKATKEDLKSTSIYDFFQDGEEDNGLM